MARKTSSKQNNNNYIGSKTKPDSRKRTSKDSSSKPTSSSSFNKAKREEHKNDCTDMTDTNNNDCMCYLRRGQMFLPPSLRQNHDNQL
mmetsp:Transcript_22416/g.21554  ORF Transcript_22416/g.21554 Transcript_22416/m.21554 type:complete len:88 (-) Transcript_22416:7-270(-)